MIYFDNAATTNYKPQEVIDSVNDTLKNFSFNSNRSGHPKAIELSQKILDTRTKIASIVNLDQPGNVVFSLNCTQALNLAIIGSVKRGGHVITTVMEHNSVLRPLNELADKKIIDVTYLTPDEKGMVSPSVIKNAIRPNTYMVIMTHISNVTGYTQDIAAVGNMLKGYGVKFLVDGAQSVGYLPIDMANYGVNMLAFPAHKGLHGIQGVGVLCFDKESAPLPIMYGGTGSDSLSTRQPTFSPDAYESGTLNSVGIVAVGEAISWWIRTRKVNLSNIAKLQEYLTNGLKQVKKCKIYSMPNAAGIVTFSVDNYDSVEVADILATKHDIALRGGLHCAPKMHAYLGTTNGGLIRASLSGENTVEECLTLIHAIENL